MNLKVNAVGDAYALNITNGDDNLMIDCGLNLAQSAKDYVQIQDDLLIQMENTKQFLLSHFHKDHYSALEILQKKQHKTNFNTIYYPCFPNNPHDPVFIKKLKMLTCLRMMLDIEINNSNDFVSEMNKVNSFIPSYKEVAIGCPPNKN